MDEEQPQSWTWEIIPAKSDAHWFAVKIIAKDDEAGVTGWWTAEVEPGGCVHYRRHYADPGGDPRSKVDTDYYHICFLDEEIARLQALKAQATKWFVEHGEGENWLPDADDIEVD
jgi:hypothetical protein